MPIRSCWVVRLSCLNGASAKQLDGNTGEIGNAMQENGAKG